MLQEQCRLFRFEVQNVMDVVLHCRAKYLWVLIETKPVVSRAPKYALLCLHERISLSKLPSGLIKERAVVKSYFEAIEAF